MKPHTEFRTPYQQYRQYHGKTCTILGLVPRDQYDFAEVGPLYWIEFDSGDVVQAWPEEVGLEEYNHDGALRGREEPEQLFVVFDGPPGPTSGRFVEVEDAKGVSVGGIAWSPDENGFWYLGPLKRGE